MSEPDWKARLQAAELRASKAEEREKVLVEALSVIRFTADSFADARMIAADALAALQLSETADQALPKDDWRPIESAPRDQNVLVVSGRFPEVHEARCYGASGWRTYGVNGIFADDPSHWMPLPAPPTTPTLTEEKGDHE